MIDLTIFFFLPLGDYASFKLQCVDIFRLFLAFFHHFSVCLSAYSVVVLNFLRYKVKVKPFHVCFSSHMPWHVAVVKLSRVWGVAAVFAFATMWMVIVLECDTFSDEMYHKYVGLFDLLVTCALPLSVMAICYIMTERLHVECSCSKSERTQPPGLNTCKVTEKVVSAINLVFLFSYVPNCALQTYAGFNMIGDFSVKVYNKWFLNAFSTFILLTNSCLYPVAVFCSNHAFRKYLKHYLPRCCTTNSPPTVIELVRKN